MKSVFGPNNQVAEKFMQLPRILHFQNTSLLFPTAGTTNIKPLPAVLSWEVFGQKHSDVGFVYRRPVLAIKIKKKKI